jgi:polysaccharide biosynthesis/export protein
VPESGSIAGAKKLWKTSPNGLGKAASPNPSCAKLLAKLHAGSGDFLIRPGRSNLIRRECSFLFGCSLVVLGSAIARAQQTPAEVNPAQSQTTAHPVPSAAQPLPAASANAHATDSASSSGDSSFLKLGGGDLIEVNVYNVPELTTKARIGNSGDVYLPLIDYVHVGDLSVEEAQALVEKRLADGGFVRSPHVSIFVDDSASQGVTVLGEVSKPGIYADLGDHKLYQIISEAGGFTASAARKVSIIRHDLPEAIQVNLPRNLADDLSGNLEVLPGDTVTVPKAPIIYVVGDVGRPSGLLVDNGSLTVLQAIALAGGTNRTAKMGGVRIIRKGSTGMTETAVPLKKMLEAKAPDITLQGDDILFIPMSGVRIAAARTFEAAMAMATSVSIYAVHP